MNGLNRERLPSEGHDKEVDCKEETTEIASCHPSRVISMPVIRPEMVMPITFSTQIL